MNSTIIKRSKFLSLILRHKPEEIGLKLDESGWVRVQDLLDACNRNGIPLTREQLNEVVETNDKQRFAFDESGTCIRANQGHSVKIDLGFTPVSPPEFLFHGTVDQFLPSIREQGLLKGQRHHVHLSSDEVTAAKVGERRGRPVILKIHAARMHCAGHLFYRSENGVWLTDHVPAEYIQYGN